jgi:hypothetical protein
VTPADWTKLAIAAAFALAAAALILRKLSGPITLTGNWQRLGDFAVFDALFSFAWKRSAKREKLELKLYATLRRSPLELEEGRPSCGSEAGAGHAKREGAAGRREQAATIPSGLT